jgi:rhomboid family GlyGly-CTERM serine protease
MNEVRSEGENDAPMITKGLHSSLQVWAVPLVLMALLFALELGGDPVREWLRFDRAAIAAGQWWRMLTGNFVHLGWWHWFLNELGVLVYVLLCPERISVAVWIRRLVLLGLGMSAGLYFAAPNLQTYVGLSGVMHGLFVLGLGRQVLKKDLIAAGCLAYLLGKLGWELFAGAPVSDEAAIGGRVALESHLWGAIAAVAYGLVFRSFIRLEQFSIRGKKP